MFDDVIIPTNGTLDQHLEDVGKVFDKLIQAGFAVRCDKVHLAEDHVMYVGFQVGAGGTQPHPSKTKALLDMSVADMQGDPAAAARYAGMIGFYHKFIPNLHSTLAAFHELKSKGVDVKETMSSLRFLTAFEYTKNQLAQVTALARPDYGKPFYIDVDAASSTGAGAVLMQLQDDADPASMRPVAWWSRRFTSEERRYGVRDQECLALVDSIEAWRSIISAGRVIVRTDHRSLEWLLSTFHREGTRVSGFALKIQGYNVEIQYVPGRMHVVADCMSRNIPTEPPGVDGGEERGVTPDVNGNRRPTIDDRVEEALTGPTTITAIAAAAPMITDRVVAFIIREREGRQELLVERQDGHTALPAVNQIQSMPALHFRSQLALRMQQTYGSCVTLHRALAAATRGKSRRRGNQCYFVGNYVGPSTPQPINHTVTAEFVNLDTLLLDTLTSVDDQVVTSAFMYQRLKNGKFVTSTTGAVAADSNETSQTGAAAADPNEVPVTDEERISRRPTGPALVDDEPSAEIATSNILDRFETSPHTTIAIDLEGHQLGVGGQVSLLQLAIDKGENGEPALVYVFDVPTCESVIFRRTERSLRKLLEDDRVVKILHCLHGDAMALFKGYDVMLEGVFDTGLADAVALGKNSGSNRGLGVVLTDWLGADVVRLTYKGGFEHEPGIWDQRPLTKRMFIYAFEDVTYCNRLYQRLRSVLQQQGLLELVFQLSRQRAPPYTLKSSPGQRVQSLMPAKLAVALCDQHGRVLCVRDEQRQLSLPHRGFKASSAETISPLECKAEVRDFWNATMGFADSEVRMAVNARLRKAVRVGQYLIYTAVVKDLVSALPAMAKLYQHLNPQSTTTLVLRQGHSPQDPSAGTMTEHRCLFQQISTELGRSTTCSSTIALQTLLPVANGVVNMHVDAQTSVSSKGRVKLSLIQVCRVGIEQAPAEVASAARALASAATTKEPTRAAVILYDKTHVFVLRTDNGELSFPQNNIDDHRRIADSAALAFDTYAGVSLRKRAGVNSHENQLLMPRASEHVCQAHANQVKLGQFGTTVYYAWEWSPLMRAGDEAQMRDEGLLDHRTAFYASRRMVNGFQMVTSKQTLHPYFEILRKQSVLTALGKAGAKSKHDLAALMAVEQLGSTASAAAVLDTSPYQVIWTLEPHALPQHSDVMVANVGSIRGELSELGERAATSSEATSTTVNVTIEPHENRDPERTWSSSLEALGMPDWGTDAEFDALFTSAVAVQAYYASTTAEAFTTKAQAAPSLTREQILAEQMSHPGTRQYIDQLKLGDIFADSADPEIVENCARMTLAHDGLLLWKGQDATPRRVVLPPRAQQQVLRLYHDANGHFGIDKVLPLILQRFYWGPDAEMRKTLSEHIRLCGPCSRSKIPHHAAGRRQILDNGEHPNDILSGDVYDVGIVYDDYSHTLDFACHFTRLISSTAVKGMPTSEEVARVLRDVVIRNRGTPREIRSDRGSNFISKAIAELYKRFRIKITAGTAYNHHLVALVERWHQTLKQLIRSQRASGLDENWPERLSMLEFAYNCTVNATTRYSPFFLNNIRQPVLPWDAMTGDLTSREVEDLPQWVKQQLETCQVTYDAASKSLRLNALHSQRKYDLRRHTEMVYRPGDRVLLIRGEILDNSPIPKADLPTEGPFTVDKALSYERYVLRDLHNRRIHNVVHVSRLIPFPDRPDFEASDWMVKDPLTGGLWPVQRVIGRRESPSGDVDYKVRWLGFSKIYDKWVPRRYLDSIAQLIAYYDDNAEPLSQPPLERSPRTVDDITVPTAPQPSNVRHFRYGPRPQERNATAGPPTEEPVEHTPITTHEVPSPDPLADPFPTDTRVDVHYPLDKQWWTGTVRNSYITRPRKMGVKPERRIVVQYDDPRYQHELFTHSVAESEVRLSTQQHAADAIDARTQRQLKRATRVTRQLL